jgi:restriction system protein
MSVPDYQTIMLPLLRAVGDGQEHLMTDVITELSNEFKLTDEERQRMQPSGVQTVMYNRVGWARTYMLKAGLLERTARGKIRITQRGKDVLSKRPTRIDQKFLQQFPEFLEFKKVSVPKDEEEEERLETPDDLLGSGYQKLKQTLTEDLLEHIKNCSPTFFENLVIDLLVAMKYGGSLEDARRVGKSGDGGIDGVIKEDKLGLDEIYVQAKRWDKGTVGRPVIQSFVGSLEGRKARKGVFITTSQFSNDAREFVKHLEKKVVLIDGEELASLMIEHGVGVAPVATYDVKKIDSDYFAEE